MKCAFCRKKSPDYRAQSIGFAISMPLCKKCLSRNSELFVSWHSLAPLISVPASVREKWAYEILIDGLKCCMPKKEITVSHVGEKGFASFFALETN